MWMRRPWIHYFADSKGFSDVAFGLFKMPSRNNYVCIEYVSLWVRAARPTNEDYTMTTIPRAVAPAPTYLQLEHFANAAGFSAINVRGGYNVATVAYTPSAADNLSPQELDGLAALMTAAPQLGRALANVIDLAEEGLRQIGVQPHARPSTVQEAELKIFDAKMLMRRLGIQHAA